MNLNFTKLLLLCLTLTVWLLMQASHIDQQFKEAGSASHTLVDGNISGTIGGIALFHAINIGAMVLAQGSHAIAPGAFAYTLILLLVAVTMVLYVIAEITVEWYSNLPKVSDVLKLIPRPSLLSWISKLLPQLSYR